MMMLDVVFPAAGACSCMSFYKHRTMTGCGGGPDPVIVLYVSESNTTVYYAGIRAFLCAAQLTIRPERILSSCMMARRVASSATESA
jgi:hypothetical protein